MENFPRTPLQTLSLAASLFAKNDAVFDILSTQSKKDERVRRGGLYDEPFSAGTPVQNGYSPPEAKKPKLEPGLLPPQNMKAVNGVPPPLRPSPAESQLPFPGNLSPKSCGDSDVDFKEEQMSPSPPASPYGNSGSPSQRGCDSPVVTNRRNSTSSTDSGAEEGKDGEFRTYF